MPDPFGSDEVPRPISPPGGVPAASHTPPPPRGARPAPRGPGLSPGIPRVGQPPAREAPLSGVVLTPKGVKRRDDGTPIRTPSQEQPALEEAPAPTPEDPNWRQYAADDFPAMAAEEFGVKTKTTDSGRIVPIAVRADLTEEAIAEQSVKGRGRRPRPAKKKKGEEGDEPARPRSFMQRIGDTLLFRRRRRRTDREPEPVQAADGDDGFARSGSLPRKDRRKKSGLAVAWNLVVEVVKIFLLVLLLRAYVVQVSQVQGPSMQPTLLEGDRLVVERITPLFAGQKDDSWVRFMPDFLRPEFKRGSVVVIRSPEDPGLELVKRLIGLPGDTIKFENGRLWLRPNGELEFREVAEHYIQAEDLKRPDGTFRSYGPGDLGTHLREGRELVVPADRLFVMGDNRSHSNDSRRWLQIEVNRSSESPGVDRLWVHKGSVEGVVFFRLWPLNRVWPPIE